MPRYANTATDREASINFYETMCLFSAQLHQLATMDSRTDNNTTI